MKIKCFTDGACSKNPGPGGFAIVYEIEGGSNTKFVYHQHTDNTTNNREELKPIILVMKYAAENPNVAVEIYSDSAYAINSLTNWIYTWASNGWVNSKKTEILNKDLIQNAYKYINKNFLNFQVYKVHGHSGVVENEIADAYASNNQVKIAHLKQQYNIVEMEELFHGD